MILNLILVVLAVDFLSGVLHWLEDSYGNPDWPIFGPWITKPNMLHHHSPTTFTRNTWLQSSAVLLVFGGIIIAVASLTGLLVWQVLLFVAIGVNANQIHKWNHLPASKRSRLVLALQKIRLVQTPEHHARHHVGLKDTNYCVVTNLVNPMLEIMHFWRILEWGIQVLFGVSKRQDPSVIRHVQRELVGWRR